ncbi:glycosyltransferase family 2 protein [Patescibacteria group bacterium]|nr:glycosyltransferase family 2 protein [Patescibacteria group bacterium]
MKKLSVIIPIYNEKNTIKTLLDSVVDVDLSNLGFKKELIIIEGNSTDGTRDIIKTYEQKPNIKIIYEDRPKGKGAAVRQGFKYVTGEIILIQDGDLEYKPSEYPLLIKPFINNNAMVVYGSRHMNNKNRQIRNFKDDRIYAFLLNMGAIIYTAIFNLLYGTKLTDPATMFKVFRTKLIKNMKFKTFGFDFDIELTAKFVKSGHKIIEIPISYKSRSVKDGKKIKFFRDGFKVFLAIVRFSFSD